MIILRPKKKKSSTDTGSAAVIAPLDSVKKALLDKEIKWGENNFLLYQRNLSFRWPLWLDKMQDAASSSFQCTYPSQLINTAIRDYIPFNNLISSDRIEIDPAGMITDVNHAFSLEFWMIVQGKIYRPQQKPGNVSISRNLENNTLHLVWKEKHFSMEIICIGAQSSIDEAILSISTELSNKKGYNALVLSVRPYTRHELGTIQSIVLEKDTGLVSINGDHSLAVNPEIDTISIGNERFGDVNPLGQEEDAETKVQCQSGMAAASFTYSFTEKKSTHYVRFPLQKKSSLGTLKFDFQEAQEDYKEFTILRSNSGVIIETPSDSLNNLFNNNKISILGATELDLLNASNRVNPRSEFFLISALMRLGFFDEAKELCEKRSTRSAASIKSGGIKAGIEGCYTILSFAEVFTHLRNLDYLRAEYEKIREFAEILVKMTSVEGLPRNNRSNTLPYNYLAEHHSFDLLLFASAMNACSYLARCMGIFGDEKRFLDEAKRLVGQFKFILEEHSEQFYNDRFRSYCFSYIFPWGLSSIDESVADNLFSVCGMPEENHPVHIAPYGIDVFASLLSSSVLLYLKNDKALDILKLIENFQAPGVSLPEFFNSRSGYCPVGKGSFIDSQVMLSCFIRNLIFIDSQDRLDLFPAPPVEWFQPGAEFKIRNAPSRFGFINFSLSVSKAEVRFTFGDAPKFIPPDIMVTLPFKAKIVEDDDFIVKKQIGNSSIINGWPSILRFKRK